MKKIINGRLYNTDTARKVAGYWNRLSERDFGYCREALYCKRTGEYFLAGEGGPQSKYSRSTGQNSWSGGEGIIPLTYGDAKEWAETAMDADAYEVEFGAISEGDLTHLHISLPADVADRIRKAAAEEGVSVSECIRKRF